jgi:hypothetical protein
MHVSVCMHVQCDECVFACILSQKMRVCLHAEDERVFACMFSVFACMLSLMMRVCSVLASMSSVMRVCLCLHAF